MQYLSLLQLQSCPRHINKNCEGGKTGVREQQHNNVLCGGRRMSSTHKTISFVFFGVDREDVIGFPPALFSCTGHVYSSGHLPQDRFRKWLIPFGMGPRGGGVGGQERKI